MALNSTSRWQRWRRTAAIAATVTALVSLAACGSSDDDSDSNDDSASAEAGEFGDITLQLSWIKNHEFIGEYFAETNGYYEEVGFSSVNLVPGPSTGIADLMQGSATVAINDAVSMGTAIANEGATVKIIGATYQSNPFTILSLADGGNIQTPDDLIGKSIGVQDSNTSLFNALLLANDIDPGDVTVVPVQYDASVLTNGEVDGFMAYLTNESIIVENEGFATTNLPFADNGLPFVAETFSATDESIENDRELLKAFLRAEILGWTDALADPEEGVRMAVEEFGADLGLDFDVEMQSATAQNEDLVVSDETAENGLFTVSDSLQAQTMATLAAAGLDLEASDLFDLSLLAEVYEEFPELIDYSS